MRMAGSSHRRRGAVAGAVGEEEAGAARRTWGTAARSWTVVEAAVGEGGGGRPDAKVAGVARSAAGRAAEAAGPASAVGRRLGRRRRTASGRGGDVVACDSPE